MAHHPLVGQGLLIIDASPSHSDTPHSVRLLCTSDRLSQRLIPDNTQHSQQKSMHPGRIRTRNPSKRAAAHPRLRPRGYWDRQAYYYPIHYAICTNLLFRSSPEAQISVSNTRNSNTVNLYVSFNVSDQIHTHVYARSTIRFFIC
jgi:hypothetical protein